jgi:hypothetical protein
MCVISTVLAAHIVLFFAYLVSLLCSDASIFVSLTKHFIVTIQNDKRGSKLEHVQCITK